MSQNHKARPENYNSQGVPEQGSWTTGSGRRRAVVGNSGIWVQKPRDRSRRHAASQGFDPGAKPGQHWRRSEHPVSADREPEWRALAWGSARLSEGGVEKGGGGRGGSS